MYKPFIAGVCANYNPQAKSVQNYNHLFCKLSFMGTQLCLLFVHLFCIVFGCSWATTVELSSFDQNHLACKGLKYLSSSPLQKKFVTSVSILILIPCGHSGHRHFLEQYCHFEGIIKIRNIFFVNMLSKGKQNYRPSI